MILSVDFTCLLTLIAISPFLLTTKLVIFAYWRIGRSMDILLMMVDTVITRVIEKS